EPRAGRDVLRVGDGIPRNQQHVIKRQSHVGTHPRCFATWLFFARRPASRAFLVRGPCCCASSYRHGGMYPGTYPLPSTRSRRRTRRGRKNAAAIMTFLRFSSRSSVGSPVQCERSTERPAFCIRRRSASTRR